MKCIFVSEIYVLDASVLDRANSVDYTDLFGSMTGVTRGGSDSTVSVDRTGLSGNNKSTSSYTLNDGLGVRIELTEVTNIGALRVSLTGETNVIRTVTPNAPCVIRFECKPTSTKIYQDDVLVLEETEDNITALVFQFRTIAGTIDNFKYKNLAIYPI